MTTLETKDRTWLRERERSVLHVERNVQSDDVLNTRETATTENNCTKRSESRKISNRDRTWRPTRLVFVVF